MTDLIAHGYAWNETVGRYRDLTTGRFISERSILGELERVTADASNRMEEITQRLLDEQISLPEWQTSMEREIKSVNRLGAVIARGGFSRMSQADWGFVGSWTKKQYKWLDRFARDLASGKQRMNGMAVKRAGMYGRAGRGLYQEMHRRMAKKRGKTQERRILGPNENHCNSTALLDGCIELSLLGWRPIGTLPPIGESPCYTHCYCIFQFR